MTTARDWRTTTCLVLGLAAAGCAAGPKLQRLEPPAGAQAFGLTFGASRGQAESALANAGARAGADPADEDALVADRCQGVPVPGPCRLRFGPAGLYAAEQDVPLDRAGALVDAVAEGLGPPRRPAGAAEGVLAAWEPPGWTVAVARHPDRQPPVATLRAAWDDATPPVVAGVPLGHRRAEVEATLAQQGAVLIQRDEEATSWLGCPLGEPEAVSCTVTFRRGRAATVTEVLGGSADDRTTLEAWRARAAAMAREIGRPGEERCPPGGPERLGGDCTVTWSSARLAVTVGAHRSAGTQHRGTLSVYTGYAYPPLTAEGD
jgi:hypothetical protein